MKIAGVQLNYKLGDFEGNFKKISDVLIEHRKQAELFIFTELCLCGYFPRDLIHVNGFIANQNHALDKIIELTKRYSISVIIGYISQNEEKGKPFHNSLCLIHQGEVLYTYHKRLLPVYNIFDEARYFAPGKNPGVFTFKGIHLGFLICEDGWFDLEDFVYESNPVDNLIQHKLDLIICINGSPSNIGKLADRAKHFTAIAKRCEAPLIFTNQVGGNDDIIFDGTSFVIDKNGNILGSLASFKESIGLLGYENKTLSLIEHFSPFHIPSNAELFYHQIILGLKDYIQKCGFKQVVIGLSGGIDSALTLALAVKALGSDAVTAILMPSQYSSDHSLTDAIQLCSILNVKYKIISIEPEFNFALTQFESYYEEEPSSITSQNIQARLRGRLLMEFSNQTGALVLSTGNKSELSVGYTTLYGDMTGGFNLIGDLYKTDVYELATYFNDLHPKTPISQAIIEKAPSAELAPNQKDTDTLPPYAILDPILKLYLEGDLLTPQEIAHYQAQLKTVSLEVIQTIHHMVNKAEFKRRQAAPIVRVQRRAFGYGRQVPIAACYPK